MKFTTLIPIKDNDGIPFKPAVLQKVVDSIWCPFRGVTEEGEVTGRWMDDDGTLFADTCLKISIECPREGLQEAIRRVKSAGRRLKQRAMYFEVSGYDGVQFLRIEKRRPGSRSRT